MADGKIDAGTKEAEGRNACAVLHFADGTKTVNLRYGISFISEEQAKENLQRELPDYNLQALAEKGRQIWDKALSDIQVEGGSDTDKQILYTSLYRIFERPVCISEGGRYFSAFDGKVHEDNGEPFYTDDWIWDTYRAAHPLRLLIDEGTEKNVIAMQSKDNAASGGEGIYWKYESTLKALDSRLYSAVGAAGELFAVRRELFEDMRTDTLLDDFILSLRIAMRGYTIAYCAAAYATESGSADMQDEEKRKVRIAAGGLQSIWRLRPLLNPFRYGLLNFQYVSHRVLRWSITPILLFLLLPLNVALLFTTAQPLFYAVILGLQILFYLMGIWGYILSRKHIKNKILFIPYYFLFMNVNVLRGFRYLSKRKGNKSGAWEKARRAS